MSQNSHILQRKKRKKWPYIILGIFVFFVVLAGGAYYLIRNMGIEGLLSSPFLQNQIVKRVGPIESDLFQLLPTALGFQGPKTYLVLFLNNTELRPGGGFMGVYATIRLDQGKHEVFVVEGTELLDFRFPKTPVPIPPQPLTDYLKVGGWYFRDSNWSPDFRESAKKALELYTREGGVAANEIDAVVGVTATVLPELMKRTGLVTIDGITFTPENVIEELEHEVEIGFNDRGLARRDRKDIIEPLMRTIVDKLKVDLLKHPLQYRELVEKLIKEKHIIAYARDSVIQDTLHTHMADGSVTETNGDYVMWVDANMAALKTDYAISRTLVYHIEPARSDTGKKYYRVVATMKYVHTRPFDWRTTRYRTYARVYVPKGSELISTEGSMKTDRSTASGVVDSGVEDDKQWFGTFISIEPLTTGTLSFTYRLPDSITTQIDQGLYTLLVQKQLGLVGARLTLDLDFDTTIKSATPSESESEWGNETYRMEMLFDSDQEFKVTFGK